MDYIRKIPNITFYYVLPMSLGFATGLAVKDSQILGNKRKISMSVCSYYKNMDENIPEQFSKILPDLDYLSKINDNKQ